MGGQRKRKQHPVVRKQREQGVVVCCLEIKENHLAAINNSVCMLVYTSNKTLTCMNTRTHTLPGPDMYSTQPWKRFRGIREESRETSFFSLLVLFEGHGQSKHLSHNTPLPMWPSDTYSHTHPHNTRLLEHTNTFKEYTIDYNDNPHCVYWHFSRHALDISYITIKLSDPC